MNARYICVYFLLPAPRGANVLAAIQCAEQTSGEKWVRFEERPERPGIDVQVNMGFYTAATQQIQQILAKS
jgi:hypothetical protein